MMVQPIQNIIKLTSLEELKLYLQNRDQLNLSIITDKKKTTLLLHSAYKNDLVRMQTYILHFKAFTDKYVGKKALMSQQASFENKLKAWVNSADIDGFTPMHYASLHGNVQMIKFLQQIGANLHYLTNDKQNALFMCCQKGQLQALIYLTQPEKKMQINSVNKQKNNILHISAREGYSDIVSYLLTLQIDVNIQNEQGRTPLMQAVKENRKQCVKRLLIYGVDRHIKDNDDYQPIKIAQQRNYTELQEILRDQFTLMEKIKIFCNLKIVYAPEKPSLLYIWFFLILVCCTYIPINAIADFSTIFYIPIAVESVYLVIVLILYILCIRKTKHPQKQLLITLKPPICPKCQIVQRKKSYHCYICDRCVYRYDHHCPWINNCVGAHNIGKFFIFLILIEIGLIQTVFLNVILIGKLLQDYIFYRDFGGELPLAAKISVHIISLIGSIMFVPVFLLLLQQFKNLTSNSTGYQRRKAKSKKRNKSSLLGSDAMNEHSSSILTSSQYEEQQEQTGCFSNCSAMLHERP